MRRTTHTHPPHLARIAPHLARIGQSNCSVQAVDQRDEILEAIRRHKENNGCECHRLQSLLKQKIHLRREIRRHASNECRDGAHFVAAKT